MADKKSVLDRILEASAKIEAIAKIVAPGVPGVGIGVAIAKFLASQFNKSKPADQQVELPSDEVLIQRLAETSARVVAAGTTFLEG